jgi:hypothetical protein
MTWRYALIAVVCIACTPSVTIQESSKGLPTGGDDTGDLMLDGLDSLAEVGEVDSIDSVQAMDEFITDPCGPYICGLNSTGFLELCSPATDLPVGATLTLTMVARCQDVFWWAFRMTGSSGFAISFPPDELPLSMPWRSLESSKWNVVGPEQPVFIRFPRHVVIENISAPVGAVAEFQMKYYYGSPPFANVAVSVGVSITSTN